MSIFSGLTPESLRAAIALARRSPKGMAALLIAGVAGVLAVGAAAAFAARHIGGFYARVQEEDELAAREEEAEQSADKGEEG